MRGFTDTITVPSLDPVFPGSGVLSQKPFIFSTVWQLTYGEDKWDTDLWSSKSRFFVQRSFFSSACMLICCQHCVTRSALHQPSSLLDDLLKHQQASVITLETPRLVTLSFLKKILKLFFFLTWVYCMMATVTLTLSHSCPFFSLPINLFLTILDMHLFHDPVWLTRAISMWPWVVVWWAQK